MQQEAGYTLCVEEDTLCRHGFVPYMAIDGLNLSILIQYTGERIPSYAVTEISSYT